MFMGRCVQIKVLVKWAAGGPVTTRGSIRSGTAPNGRVRGLDTACSGHRAEQGMKTSTTCPGQANPAGLIQSCHHDTGS